MKRKLIAQGVGQAEDAYAQKQAHSLYIQFGIYALLTALSILIPRTTVYGGLSPFGVSVAACVDGPASVIVCIGAAIGYMLPSTVTMPLRYVASLICIVGFQWAFGTYRKIVRHSLFAPILSASSILVTGIVINSLNGFQWDIMVTQICEAMLCGGFAYFFKAAVSAFQTADGPRSFDLHQQASIAISAAVVLMSVNTLVFHDISVGRIVTMTVILLAAKAGQQQGGTLVGVILGAATVLCSPDYAHLAAGYAFGGLLTGLFSRFGRLASAAIFSLVNALIAFGMGDSDRIVIGIYEVLASSLLFLVLPPSVERAVNAVFVHKQSLSAVEGVCRSVDMRLTYAADTMNDIAKTVDTVSEKLAAMNTPDLKEVYTHISQILCSGCRRREYCWRSEFADTMAVFRAMGKTLQTNGVLRAGDVIDRFEEKCHHFNEVLTLMNNGYARFVTKENAYRRLSDIRGIVTDQFEGMASLLSELSEDFQNMDRVDLEAAARIEQVCERYHMPIIETVCLIGRRNRLTVEILMEGDKPPVENSRWHKDVCDACGCILAAPTVTKSGTLMKVRLSEKPRFTAHFSCAQLNCGQEKLCGDAFEDFYDNEGRYCIVLSDGMGSGGRAAVDGAMTAALAARMLQAGFCFDNMLRVINSALIVKSSDESLSTLDAVRVDLFTGYIHGLKAGAAPSFLYSKGRITQIAASSLPIGILQEIDAEGYEDYMGVGDILVMVSDGVVCDDTDWLEELICRLAKQHTDEKAMASEIVFRARERQGNDKTDDTTALVLRIA